MGITLKSTAGKVLASLTLVAAAAGVAGLGTYGGFSNSTAASATVKSGLVKIELGPAGTWGSYTDNINGLLPGDSVQRLVSLKNTGDQDFGGVALTTNSSTSNPLTTNTTMGLQIAIDNCAAGWVEAGKAPGFTYSCPGGATPVLASQPMIGANRLLGNLASLTAGKADTLRITGTFPAAADNTLKDLTSTLTLTFTATQRLARQ